MKNKLLFDRKLLQIIDANTNRAVEGLRVVEEICRFVLEEKGLTNKIKLLRGQLRSIIRHDYAAVLQSRDLKSDVGKALYTENEGKRSTLSDILQANLKRVEEALRVLEEFSKLIYPAWGKKYKSLRFVMYNLEKKIPSLF